MSRIFAISDVHSDYQENLKCLEDLSLSDHQNDALILAGDVSHKKDLLQKTFDIFQERFSEVFFLPGNHELWVPNESGNSLEKFHEILALCDSRKIYHQPRVFHEMAIYPLYSWYDDEFATEDTPRSQLGQWKDFLVCDWPVEESTLSAFFADMNLPLKTDFDCPIISFSHFLPRRDLLPPFPHLRFQALARVSGSEKIEKLLRELGSVCHVFGHTHINIDIRLEGVRYLQNSLRYPRERKRFPGGQFDSFLVEVSDFKT